MPSKLLDESQVEQLGEAFAELSSFQIWQVMHLLINMLESRSEDVYLTANSGEDFYQISGDSGRLRWDNDTEKWNLLES